MHPRQALPNESREKITNPGNTKGKGVKAQLAIRKAQFSKTNHILIVPYNFSLIGLGVRNVFQKILEGFLSITD